ncbi:MAG: hypothetical protein NZR01_11145 [Bryobacteraceae bacterium]|nr:hypothetical protein [Bryobacteraceae bacterium]
MMKFTRRELAALLAVQGSTGEIPRAVIERHDRQVEELLARQQMDPRLPGFGSYADEYGLFHAGSAAWVAHACMAAFACPGSRFHRDPLMIGRTRAAAEFLRKSQHEDGTIDLLTTNFHSPPDLGFVMHHVAAAVELARLGGAREAEAALEPFLRRAKGALLEGGVHTPNHRWVVCEALAMLHHLGQDERCLRRIREWLAEGVDIDEDGQFSERSTGVYNPVTDKALLVTALRASMPELLDPVRRNLDSMLFLLHPGGEVVTEISTRQDQFTRATMDRYWFPLRYLALHDGNGRWAALVRSIEDRAASLSEYLRYPELRRPLPAPEPLPEHYHRLMKSLRIARIRRGAWDATVLMNGNSRFLTLRHGACAVEGVRFAAAFFGKGQFRCERWQPVPGGYRLAQQLEGWYCQPLGGPVGAGMEDYRASLPRRRRTEIQRLDYEAVVTETAKGVAVRIRAQGTANVPLAVEVILRGEAELRGVEPAAAAEKSFLLRNGFAEVRQEGRGWRFGPGLALHSYTQVRGAELKPPGQSVYLCGFTPFDHTLEFTPI